MRSLHHMTYTSLQLDLLGLLVIAVPPSLTGPHTNVQDILWRHRSAHGIPSGHLPSLLASRHTQPASRADLTTNPARKSIHENATGDKHRATTMYDALARRPIRASQPLIDIPGALRTYERTQSRNPESGRTDHPRRLKRRARICSIESSTAAGAEAAPSRWDGRRSSSWTRRRGLQRRDRR